MRRSYGLILAGVAASLAFATAGVFAQTNLTTATNFPAIRGGAVEHAESASSGSSSSNAPELSGIPAQSSITIQMPPAADRPVVGAGPFSGIAVGVRFGVAGIGFDVATPLVRQRLNLRGGASFFSYTPGTITTDSYDINGNIKLQNSFVVVDYFPFHGRFRLSGGMTVYNRTGLTAAVSVPTGQSFSIGGMTFYSEPYNAVTNPAGPVLGTGVFTFGDNKIAPRVTIGTGNMLPRKGRFTFESEIGFQYFSAPTVVYTLSGTGCTTYAAGVYANCGPIPQANIVDEQNKLQNDLTDLRFFPILSVGLSFKIH